MTPQSTAKTAPQEKSRELLAYLTVLTRLIAFTKREFGRKHAEAITGFALLGTQFEGLPLTEDGFDIDNLHVRDRLMSFSSNESKKAAYQIAINRFFAQLAAYTPQAELIGLKHALLKDVRSTYHMPVEINGETQRSNDKGIMGWFSSLFKSYRPKESSNVSAPTDSLLTMQESLVTKYHQLSALLRHITPDAVLLVNSKKEVVFVNVAAEKLLKTKDSYILNQRLDSIIMLANDNGRISDEVYLPALSTQSQPFLFEGKRLILLSAKDKDTYVNVQTRLLGYQEHTDALYVITLSEANKEEMVDNSQKELISVTAHELKTPITSLRGYLAMLQDDMQYKLTEDQKTFLSRMASSTNQLLLLIDNLLAFSKIESKSLHLRFESVSAEELIENIIAQLTPLALTKHVTLTFEHPNNPLPLVAIDTFRISEVITNLITNAIKFNKIRGGIWIRAFEEEGMLRIEVSDNGEGIPEDAMPKLFNKYFQARLPDTENQNTGAGLGLYIAKEIISAHNGFIGATSEYGKGSTFTFRVPIKQGLPTQVPQKRYFTSAGQPLSPVS